MIFEFLSLIFISIHMITFLFNYRNKPKVEAHGSEYQGISSFSEVDEIEIV